MATNLRDQMANIINPRDGARSSPEDRPLLRSFPNPNGYGSQSTSAAKAQERSALSRLVDYLAADIDTRWGELVLIASFFVTGMVDAGAYNAYNCFVSMQTGNTIFAALGASDLPITSPRLAWTKSFTSVVVFILGSAIVGWFHNAFGRRKRWVLVTSFIVQTLLIIVSGVLVLRGHSSDSPHAKPNGVPSQSLPADPGFPWRDLIPIGLLSFQAAAKVVASRVLGQTDLPCVVLTTLYADMASDPHFFTAGLLGNAKRNGRIGGTVFFFIGAVLGGVAAGSAIGFSGALFIAAGVQVLTVMAWLLWRADQSDDQTSLYINND